MTSIRTLRLESKKHGDVEWQASRAESRDDASLATHESRVIIEQRSCELAVLDVVCYNGNFTSRTESLYAERARRVVGDLLY